ncbi:phospholipase A2 inhibitor and Ly6/PLAUR domain-containing protein-like [Paralichthys olivaceus]|uniref:phospholipase A2 inhibitor and Ly6/PLAUR domain-containing protein-like n=1 Tax=Paralichthys olivaceus TaxID=8255 RepID=UPI003751DA43
MKLLLTVCVTWALLYPAESLNCNECTNEMCTGTTSVQCPASMTVCRTVTSANWTGLSTTVMVKKSCSSLQDCFTPLNTIAVLSVNAGLFRHASTQICCGTDNCNSETLAIPSSTKNGKECPSCASPADSLDGTCDATLNCLGAENSCFSSNITISSTKVTVLGCTSENLCSADIAMTELTTGSISIKCGAPWSISISAMLVTFALSSHKFLV